MGAAGRAPCNLCSTATPAAARVGGGSGGGIGSGVLLWPASNSSAKDPGDVPQARPAQWSGAASSAEAASLERGTDRSCFIATFTSTLSGNGLTCFFLADNRGLGPIDKTSTAMPP